ncbi:2-oxoacid ferredoxin oxidoreductase [Antarctobacter heliothermus]|uniref:2-oxoacid ferredoxin oxidoreductase n=1 Tax=Antarctobacter heliothermus TaxID=74033 RepID=A0A222E4T5_9RHOB|nr:indolepyruvate ferredoxin oxidoreductase family protein [Antarctobacter heliothermus]ASP21229.1 2-oxoacid ferredoxin oxidoreductase [Antarctobacter heliothermus]
MSLHQSLDVDERLSCAKGTVFLSGVQVLARLALDQSRADRARGLKTGGYVSGYRGSPLAGLDRELMRLSAEFAAHDVQFHPAVNEDLAATAIWGTQQLAQNPTRRLDGVFGLWYGKGPGLDRSMDAVRHGAAYGASPLGGVVMLVGDDHAASSSTVAHQSDAMLAAAHVPVLHPTTLQNLRLLGRAAIEISRQSGAWVALKCQTELMEISGSIDLDEELPPTLLGTSEPDPALHTAVIEMPPMAELRIAPRIAAVQRLVAEAGLDRITTEAPNATIGIIATGKASIDLNGALLALGLSPEDAGIRIYRPALVWPLEPTGALRFASGLKQILVVEEKDAFVETQLRALLSERLSSAMPQIMGKRDATGEVLLPATGALDPQLIATAVARFLGRDAPAPAKQTLAVPTLPRRRPFFCAGCPHNSSTNLPEGSRAFAGIGCHSMVIGTGRNTDGFTQMGAEGVVWLGQSPFCDENHVFVNMGDGTYFHSGLLAIRAAVAAKVNATYKVLFNDAVAMTGGQTHDGTLTPGAIGAQIQAEGVRHVAIVSDDPARTRASGLPPGVKIHHRDMLDRVSQEMRDTPGITAIVYDQTCATELRRRRKRGKAPVPTERIAINSDVCEGCGDCTLVSNCVAVEPRETWKGLKRQINQSTCNTDKSCLGGFCPSFVTITNGATQKPEISGIETRLAGAILPQPALTMDRPADILIAGIGGTGVLTMSAILGMAAHLSNQSVTLLDQSGLAQKNGAVRSHVRIGHPDIQNQPARLTAGSASLLIAADVFTAADPNAIGVIGPQTAIIANGSAPPPVEFLSDRNVETGPEAAIGVLKSAGRSFCQIDAQHLAVQLIGSGAFANVILVGAAWQSGAIPLSQDALEQAITLNGVAVRQNLLAFAIGRAAVAAPDLLTPAEQLGDDADLATRRHKFLTAFQSTAWADRHAALVRAVAEAETPLVGAPGALTEAVSKTAFRLMTYKDEYEVARLLSSDEFVEEIRREHGPEAKVTYHLAPPLLAWRRDSRGRPAKMRFGSWLGTPLRLLARFKGLRGTAFDPFGHSLERRTERALVDRYERTIRAILPSLSPDTRDMAYQIALMPGNVRGFGPVKHDGLVAAGETLDQMLDAYLDQAKKPANAPGKVKRKPEKEGAL